MASFLDILAQDYTNQRGQLNPFALARGFTGRGRAEIDQQTQLQDLQRQAQIAHEQRQSGAINTMSGKPDAMTWVPGSPEEGQIAATLLDLLQTQANIKHLGAGTKESSARGGLIGAQTKTEEQLLGPRVDQLQIGNVATAQNVDQSGQLFPGVLEGQGLGNEGQRLTNQRTRELLPGEVGLQAGAVEGQRLANQRTGTLTPLEAEAMRAGTAGQQFQTSRGQQLLPGELGAQTAGITGQNLANDRTRLMTPLELTGVQLSNDMGQQTLEQNNMMFPERMRGVTLGNDQTQTAIDQAISMLPHLVAQQMLQNQLSTQDLDQRREVQPHIVEGARLGNRVTTENLTEQVAGQTDRLRTLENTADQSSIQTDEMQRTSDARVRATEAASRLDPRVKQLLDVYPYLDPASIPDVVSYLDLPQRIPPEDDAKNALLKAIEANARGKGGGTVPSGGNQPPSSLPPAGSTGTQNRPAVAPTAQPAPPVQSTPLANASAWTNLMPKPRPVNARPTTAPAPQPRINQPIQQPSTQDLGAPSGRQYFPTPQDRLSLQVDPRIAEMIRRLVLQQQAGQYPQR